ncbi:hypothetical protein FRC07_013070, partial [Ceratobasidium sp. 392]
GVDLTNSIVKGCMTIHGLVEEYPELTTYFEGEIIGERPLESPGGALLPELYAAGSKHGFLSQAYDATEADDMIHWK